MNKIYLGGLNPDITVESITNLFNEYSVEATNIVANKKGFAFADCKDPTAAEKAIEKLNGITVDGKEVSVEHSVPRGSKSKKVQVRNIPSHLNWEQLDKLLAEYGAVENCEQVSTESDSATVNVTYTTRAEAQNALRELNGKMIEEKCQLKVSFLPDPSDAARPQRGNRFMNNNYNGPYNGNGFGNRPKIPDLPTRMLVPSQYVGAIIGKGGATIKQITQETHARVDVHRKENPGATEKAVTINGAIEACAAAVAKILEIVREEDRNARTAAGTWTGDELPLKLLAHNSLIGRLIGKDGRNLKAIQEKVDTKIAISKDSGRSPLGYYWHKGSWHRSMAELTIFNAERTITIFGDPKKCEEAQQLLMEKLRSCYENDMTSAYQVGPHEGGTPGGFMGPPQSMYGPPQAYGQMQQPLSNVTETCVLYIPSNSVGAIIGTKGSHIRNVSRIANASIKISPPDNGDGDKERRVTIIGSPEGQWKAQFCIFDKLKQEGFFGNEEGRLTSEIVIPASLVGRIIGKGGNNVRELQRLTSSEVVIPRQSDTEGMEEVPVKITGHFFSIQSAQRKIREMLSKAKEVDRNGKMRNGVKPRNSYEG